MSAFMFVLSAESIKSMSLDELKASLTRNKDIVDNFDWSKYKQCTFDSDYASGCQANVVKLQAEIDNRNNGTSNEIPYVLVPGYNPGKA